MGAVSASGRISGGAPNGMPTCPSCPYLRHDKKHPGWGWCDYPYNRVQANGWVNGFTPSQSPTGSCELHPERRMTAPPPKEKAMGNYTPAQERANAIADRQALVGTLASLPAHVQAVVKAYGAACARTAVDDAATLRQQAGRVDMRDALQQARDHGSAAWDEWLIEKVDAAIAQGDGEAVALPEFLKDPVNVHAMMLRGAIAIPSIRSMVDLRGEVPNGEDAQLARIAELQEQLDLHAERARVPELARALVDTIDNECERVTSDAVWAAKERLQEQLAAPSQRAEVDRG